MASRVVAGARGRILKSLAPTSTLINGRREKINLGTLTLTKGMSTTMRTFTHFGYPGAISSFIHRSCTEQAARTSVEQLKELFGGSMPFDDESDMEPDPVEGEELRSMPFDDVDMESDDTIGVLYDRWIEFHGLSRTRTQKFDNYYTFKDLAKLIHAAKKQGLTLLNGLHKYADSRKNPYPVAKYKGPCFRCLAQHFGPQLKEIKVDRVDSTGKLKVTLTVTNKLTEVPEYYLPTTCCNQIGMMDEQIMNSKAPIMEWSHDIVNCDDENNNSSGSFSEVHKL